MARAAAHSAKTSSGEFTFLHKTVLCRFHTKGMCNRGAQCTFAHGGAALKTKPDFAKTKMCPNLQRGGRCCDVDCAFAHTRSELRRVPKEMLEATLPAPRPAVHGEAPLGQIPLPTFITRASAPEISVEKCSVEKQCGSEISSQLDSTEDLGESSLDEWSDAGSASRTPAGSRASPPSGPEPLWLHVSHRGLEVSSKSMPIAFQYKPTTWTFSV